MVVASCNPREPNFVPLSGHLGAASMTVFFAKFWCDINIILDLIT